jgi:two-component system chemotaxis response regulator CheY
MPIAAKIHAVVVDDQATMRALVKAVLQQIGIANVREFQSGSDALAHLRAQPAHLVLSDFNMPQMDGIELLRQMRANPEMANTAFILLTGRADKDLVVRAIQFGANNYLVKPFTAAVLKQKIEQVVGALM